LPRFAPRLARNHWSLGVSSGASFFLTQTINSFAQMTWRKVRIPHHHDKRPVSEQLADTP